MTSDLYEDEPKTESQSKISLKDAFGTIVPLLKEHKRRLGFSLVLLTATTGLALAWPMILKEGIDGPLKTGNITLLVLLALAILVIQAAAFLIQYLQRLSLEQVGQDVMLSLKRRLFDHILSLDFSYFDSNPVGRIMARVESDCEALRMLFTNTVVLLVGDMLLILGIYSIMVYQQWQVGVILFLSVPLLCVLIYFFHRLTTHRFFAIRRKMAEVTAVLSEFLQGMSIVQLFHRGEYARKRVYETNEIKFADDQFVQISVCVFFNLILFIEYVKIGLLLMLGPRFDLSAGQIVLFLVLIMRSFEPIFRTSEQLSSFQKGIAGARRIYELLATKPVVLDPVRPELWNRFDDAIRFEDVSFSYTGDSNYALKNATFDIPKGKRVALVGVTGGGKSTVISLLLRFYDPQMGRITVDGIDIRDVSRADLRRKFALVLQDIILFPGDVKNNIGLGAEEIPQERIAAAAQVVDAALFIDRLPKRYETEISEKGSNFSRGERQLLSFARALAFDPEILILDEATSSVDPETERVMAASLKILMHGRTSLIIAHRLSTILDVDKILVIKQGEIIESGTHTELLLQNGYYTKLFHLQFKSKIGELTNA
ncbi:MAG: ABC transporter ATP-binding protein [candidate division Zixibacteria bacterium]|nr:ABC transporter ATP-binding protein [candidate division Zixibacteria bacterium]